MPSQRTRSHSRANSASEPGHSPSQDPPTQSGITPESAGPSRTAHLDQNDKVDCSMVSRHQQGMEGQTYEPQSAAQGHGPDHYGMATPLHTSTPSSMAALQMTEMYRALPHGAIGPVPIPYQQAFPIYAQPAQIVQAESSHGYAIQPAQQQQQPQIAHYAPSYPRYGAFQPCVRGGHHNHHQQHQHQHHRYQANYGQIDRYGNGSNSGTNLSSGQSRWPHHAATGDANRITQLGATPACSRGPPRKPKQSGHALWVGNLPTYTQIIELKDHFSKDATNDIESVFLISKSNCAFVNYRTEESCVAAVKRFHESRFHGMRLVCRLRKGNDSSEAAGAPASSSRPSTSTADSDVLAAASNRDAEELKVDPGPTIEAVSVSEEGDTRTSKDESTTVVASTVERTPERYFIVKSLTVEDLEASVRDGAWATQSHNERILHEAFESSDAVYLVFSVNKSGEYFGYAKMLSGIDKNHTSSSTSSRVNTPQSSDGPTSRVTPVTQHAPKGRVIDDSARGTIFWEADSTEASDDATVGAATAQVTTDASFDGISGWGRPFKIVWVSTEKLPFHRTRGLRNPWNSNREVKIARDGIELEPGVGRRLIQMFHHPRGMAQYGQPRPPQPNPGNFAMPMSMPLQGPQVHSQPYPPFPYPAQHQHQQHHHFQHPAAVMQLQHMPAPQPQYMHQPVIAKSPHTTRAQPHEPTHES